jgi:hypothetical protein
LVETYQNSDNALHSHFDPDLGCLNYLSLKQEWRRHSITKKNSKFKEPGKFSSAEMDASNPFVLTIFISAKLLDHLFGGLFSVGM